MESTRIPTDEELVHSFLQIAKAYTVRNGKEWTPYDQIREMLTTRDAAIRAECADKAVKCFFTTMAESGLSTGNDYAVLVISDKIRDAIMGGKNE